MPRAVHQSKQQQHGWRYDNSRRCVLGLILMMGPPGAGKGTQSQKIRDRHPTWQWLSSGDMLRHEVAQDTPLGRKAHTYIVAGKLVPDELLSEVLLQKLDEYQSTHVILDGYPRNLYQTTVLEQSQHPILAIFRLIISHTELMKRIAERADLEGRSDDSPEKLAVRLEIYEKEMKQVYTHYQSTMSRQFCRLSAVGAPDSIAGRIQSFLRTRT